MLEQTWILPSFLQEKQIKSKNLEEGRGGERGEEKKKNFTQHFMPGKKS